MNKTVHIPNAGTAASVTRNRSSFPATVSKRTDNDANYDIDEFTIDPITVEHSEEVEASYNKMESLLIDAMLLSLYPNGYLHFLRDALTLRHKEYTVSPTYAKSRKDSWDRFRTSKRATEVYCRRIWKDMFGREPEPVPEDWDLGVAREQGLMEDKYRPFPIA